MMIATTKSKNSIYTTNTATRNSRIDEMDEDTHIYHNFMLCKERFVRWTEKDTNPSQVLDMDPEKIGRHFLGVLPRICPK